MSLKGLVLVAFVCLGTVDCVLLFNHFHHHHQPVHHHDHLGHHHHEEHHDHHPKYEFEYGVKDPKTGDEKSQHEHRDGDHVKGKVNYFNLFK